MLLETQGVLYLTLGGKQRRVASWLFYFHPLFFFYHDLSHLIYIF